MRGGVGGWSTPVPIFSREKIEIIDPYFDQILMDLRKFWENYRHFFKKAVIFWKNETVLKVCWLGVEKLGIFGLFGGVGGWSGAVLIFTSWGQGLPKWQPLAKVGHKVGQSLTQHTHTTHNTRSNTNYTTHYTKFKVLWVGIKAFAPACATLKSVSKSAVVSLVITDVTLVCFIPET